MSEGTQKNSDARLLWAGRVMSALPVLVVTMSTFMKLSNNPQMAQMFVEKLGYRDGMLASIGALEALCLVLYLVPRTSVLGAVLLTGYLGGAIATHVRIGDPFAVPLFLGVLVWGGLFLRDARLRALLPLRKPAAS
ncbi:membrane protein [Minicystis rosea]|nr:membrane protein [Minicystis rosea]